MDEPLKDVSRLNSFLVPLLLCNDADAPWFSKGVAEGSYAVASGNDGGGGGAGPHDVRRDSAAGTRGEGYDVRLDAGVVTGGLIDDIDDGRDGNNCESLFDPEVFLRTRGGRLSQGAFARSVAGDPARRAEGTASVDGLRSERGEPIWSGDGTPAIVCSYATAFKLCLHPLTFSTAAAIRPYSEGQVF